MELTKCDLIIRDCRMLNEDFDVENSKSIAIKDSFIIDIGQIDYIEKKYRSSEIIDGRNKLIMPGLVDAHTHTCQQLLRGRIMDEFPMIWKRIMVPFESNLTEEDVEISAKLSCLEMIKSGTTSFSDAGGKFMHKVAEVVLDSGLRAALSCSTMDQGNSLPASMVSTEREAIDRNIKLFNDYNNSGKGRLKIWFSLRTLISCSESLIKNIFEIAKSHDTGVHVHMNEYAHEINFCLENHQMRPLEYLESLGVLGPNLISAHSILLSENEIDILKKYDVKVVHCPISNFGKGVHKTPRLLQSKIPVALGTDGTAHAGKSIFNEIKVFRSAMHANLGVAISDPLIMPAKSLLEIATRGGAKVMLSDHIIGMIKVGMKADMIMIDINQPHIMPTHNMLNTIVEAVGSQDVSDMLVDGKVIMRDRKVLTMDEEEIMRQGQIALENIAKRAQI